MMISKTLLLLRRVARNLVARVVFGAVLAFAMAFLSPLFEPLLPDEWEIKIGPDAVIPILNILATTMLTVTTFSLSVMVQAYQAAASQATPRAYRLHLSDTTTHTVLAVFTGAFLYSLTALVMFRAGLYPDNAAVMILGVTVLVIVAIIVSILRWIEHLSTLGSMDDALQMVDRQAREPLYNALRRPALGGLPVAPDAEIPEAAWPLPAPSSGYLQFVNMEALHDALAKADASITLIVSPGAHVLKGAPLGWVLGDIEERTALSNCFTFGEIRTAEQDARFGVVVLNETAVRALSPGINDPGTAVDVVHRLARLFSEAEPPKAQPPQFPRIEAPALTATQLMEDGFEPLIRAGAGHPEVIGTVLDTLAKLEHAEWRDLAQAARRTRAYALHHAQESIEVKEDRDALARRV